MQKVRWGILSTAKIGTQQVIPAMQQGDYCSIDAIASRTEENARESAKKLGIDKYYGSYEALLADEDIDAIYNPLPNHMHIPWTLKALKAGKHVLCEKPLGMDAEEVAALQQKLIDYPELKVMEAFMYKFHPQWVQVQSWLGKKTIGTLRSIHTSFSYYNDDPHNIRSKPEWGGGALMDIGCYGISVARFLFRDEPLEVKGIMERDPKMKIDRLTSGVLTFAKGQATFHCSMQSANFQEVRITGTEGHIVITVPFNPQPDEEVVLKLTVEGKTEDILVPRANQFTRQGDIFSKAILEGRNLPITLNDAFGNMKVIDAIVNSDNA